MKKWIITLLATLGYTPKWAVQKKNGHVNKSELASVSSGNDKPAFYLRETADRFVHRKHELEMEPVCRRVAVRLQMRSLQKDRQKDNRLEAMFGPGGFLAEQANLASEKAVRALRLEMQEQELQQIALGSQIIHRQFTSEDSTTERTERRVALCQGRFFLVQLLHAAEQGGESALNGQNLPTIQWITESQDQFNKRELTAAKKARKAAEKVEVVR